jgi:RimJ/RimL family protein N-acetyltransferase
VTAPDTRELPDWTPASRPAADIRLEGGLVRLEPVDPDRHTADLFDAAHGLGADPALWRYLPYGPFADAGEMGAWVAGCAASADPQFMAIVDAASGRALGMASYMRIEPVHGVIEIGHIWFGRALQRSPAATEAIHLLARHAFEDLGNRRLEWKCDAANVRSRRAADRFGFVFEGVFRQAMVVKGRNRDTAWYSLLDREWPAARAAFEAWLDAGNFDAEGRQRHSLASLRASA